MPNYTLRIGHPVQPVTGLTVNASSASTAVLAWTSTASTFNIYRDTDPQFGSPTLIKTGHTQKSYQDTALTGLTLYYWKVYATSSGVEAALSPTVSARTPATPPTSRNYSHMRSSTRDFLIHYCTPQNGFTLQEQSDYYDFAASHYDDIWSGTPSEYTSRNANALPYLYALLWHPYVNNGTPSSNSIEAWVETYYPGTDPEDLFVHYAGGSKVYDNRVKPVVPGFTQYIRNVPNFGEPKVQAYFLAHLASSEAAGYASILYDSVSSWAFDNAGMPSGATLEYATRQLWIDDMATLLAALKAAATLGHVAVNTGVTFTSVDIQLADAAGCTYPEFCNQPLAEVGYKCWGFVSSRLASGTKVWFAPQRKPQNLLDIGGQPANINEIQTMYADRRERVLVSEYCNFLMLQVADLDLLTFQTFGDESWGVYRTYPHEYTWLTMFETDLGTVSNTRTLLQSGTDNSGQLYQCWYRTLDNALVLYRPRLNWAHLEYGDNTMLTFTLPSGTWQQLWPDGSLTGTVTTVDLRNGEGAIFMDAS